MLVPLNCEIERCARHPGSCIAGSRKNVPGIFVHQRGTRSQQRVHQVAGRHHVGLGGQVVLRRAARTIAGDPIVAGAHGVFGLHGAHRDGMRAAAGRQNRPVSVAAIISGRHHHHDSGSSRPLPPPGKRILRAALIIGRPTDKLITRMLYCFFSATAFCMAAITTLSLLAPFLIQNAQIEQIRVRRDAFEGAEGARLVRRAPLPATMPATCVPWPKSSLRPLPR